MLLAPAAVLFPMPFDYDHITHAMEARQDRTRFLHTLGVCHTAATLAAAAGSDADKGALAGLLHDAAKHLPLEQQFELAARAPVAVFDSWSEYPGIVHAPASATLAAEEFGVTDTEVLDAIAHHPTGRPNPSALLKALVVADYIEPCRDFPGLGEIRDLARRDLDAALGVILPQKARHLEERDRPVHPFLFACIESLGHRSPDHAKGES